MGRLLPTRSDVAIERRDDPRLLCIDDDRTKMVLAALSSDTSQAIFRALNEDPKAARDLATELDLSVQNVAYHLENLEDAGLIEVLDTCYSEKGQEMDIYGPATEPLLVYLGLSSDRPGMTEAFKRFAAAIGPVAVVLSLGETVSRLVGADE